MLRPLGLHQLTAMDVGPIELIEIAAKCGYSHVSLFTNAPVVPIAGQEGKFQFPTVTTELKGEVLARLRTGGVNEPLLRLGSDFQLDGELVERLASVEGIGNVALTARRGADHLRLVA